MTLNLYHNTGLIFFTDFILFLCLNIVTHNLYTKTFTFDMSLTKSNLRKMPTLPIYEKKIIEGNSWGKRYNTVTLQHSNDSTDILNNNSRGMKYVNVIVNE